MESTADNTTSTTVITEEPAVVTEEDITVTLRQPETDTSKYGTVILCC